MIALCALCAHVAPGSRAVGRLRPLRAVRARPSSVCADVARRNGDARTYGGKRCGKATATSEEPGLVAFVFFVLRESKSKSKSKSRS